MPKMNVLFDGNGGPVIRVVGLGDFIRFEAHNAALVNANAERDALAAKAAALDALIVAMQERATLYLQPGGEPNANFISYILTMLDGPEQRAAQATPVQCLANVRADAIKKAAQKALDAAQVPPASPIRSDYFKAGVRCCAAALVEYAEKVRGGAV